MKYLNFRCGILEQPVLAMKLAVYFFACSITQTGIGGVSPIPGAAFEWPMASCPKGTWTVNTEKAIPTSWSVTANENVRWKTELPEGGQSGIAVWDDRLFLTINKPLPEGTPLEKMRGSDIVGYCLDSGTGKVI